jgi:hypothetical protein
LFSFATMHLFCYFPFSFAVMHLFCYFP